MEDLIARLYPEKCEQVLSGIDRLREKYHSRAQNSDNKGLSERDAILITYGDGLLEEGKLPLATLAEFASEHLSGCVSAIHLLPCFPFTSDDGFSVTDYYQIDPQLGNWQHIDSLGREFDLMFDAVVNHISKSSHWFQEFQANRTPYNEYFIKADPSADYSKVVRPRALPLLHSYDQDGKEVHVWTTFSEDQVDLNYHNYQVFLHVLDVLLFYASRGSRFIRLDAIAFLWKEAGTSCIHLDQTHWIIQAYRSILEEVFPGTVLITETNVPHHENISYFGNGSNEAHMVYNFTLPPLLAYSIHQEDVRILTQWARSIELPGDEVCFFNFTASHDGIGVRPLQGIVDQEAIKCLADIATEHGGFVSYKNNEDGSQSPYELNCNYMDLITHPSQSDSLRVQRFLLTQSVMLCMPGVPGIYYHSLLGSENDRQAAIESGINRRINRKKLEVKELLEDLGMEGGLRNTIFSRYSEMLRIRTSQKAFHPVGSASYEQSGPLFIIRREHKGELLFGIHNFSGIEYGMKALTQNCTDLFTGANWEEENWDFGPYEFKWLKKT